MTFAPMEIPLTNRHTATALTSHVGSPTSEHAQRGQRVVFPGFDGRAWADSSRDQTWHGRGLLVHECDQGSDPSTPGSAQAQAGATTKRVVSQNSELCLRAQVRNDGP